MTVEPYNLELEIIPSPGTEIPDWKTMEQKIQLVKPFARVVHIDIVDGKFAPKVTFADPAPFASYTKETQFEVHLMVDDPVTQLDKWAQAGFTRFIGQVEKMPDVAAFVAKAEDLGDVGLAVDSPTTIETIFPYIEDIDFALVMTVKAGLSNQQFLPGMLEKVRKLRETAAFLPIEIDGGVNEKTIAEAKRAGATRFVTTGFLFGSTNSATQFSLLEKAVGLGM